MVGKAELAKENYRLLRDAGYSAAEARTMRSKGRDTVRKLLAAKGVELESEETAQEPKEVVTRGGTRGNKARRLLPEESRLLDKMREAGISPEEVEAILVERLEEWVSHWDRLAGRKKPVGGASVMAEKLGGQLAVMRS